MKMTLPASFALILSCGSALAAQNPLVQACAPEIQRFCRTIAPVGQLACLQAQSANLSAACGAAISSQSQAAGASQANATGTGTTAPQTGGAAANPAPRGDGY